jgi:hypothetical protein
MKPHQRRQSDPRYTWQTLEDQRLSDPKYRWQKLEDSRWPKWLRLVWAAVIVYVLWNIALIVHPDQWPSWTGFGQTEVKPNVQPAKTLWDWLELLIIPSVLAIGCYLLSRSENRATQAAAERRAQDDTLQAYLDGMALLPRTR